MKPRFFKNPFSGVTWRVSNHVEVVGEVSSLFSSLQDLTSALDVVEVDVHGDLLVMSPEAHAAHEADAFRKEQA
jgi:hypothetical protein